MLTTFFLTAIAAITGMYCYMASVCLSFYQPCWNYVSTDCFDSTAKSLAFYLSGPCPAMSSYVLRVLLFICPNVFVPFHSRQLLFFQTQKLTSNERFCLSVPLIRATLLISVSVSVSVSLCLTLPLPPFLLHITSIFVVVCYRIALVIRRIFCPL